MTSNISSNKWTREEELNFIKEIANGERLESIAIKHKRNPLSLELQLKKIIFENISVGRSFESIADGLKLDLSVVRQYFYAYKDFREKNKGISVIDGVGVKPVITKQAQEGGNHDIVEKMTKKIKLLETENQMMKTIIENKELNKKIKKLVAEGAIDPNVKFLMKAFRKKNKVS